MRIQFVLFSSSALFWMCAAMCALKVFVYFLMDVAPKTHTHQIENRKTKLKIDSKSNHQLNRGPWFVTGTKTDSTSFSSSEKKCTISNLYLFAKIIP